VPICKNLSELQNYMSKNISKLKTTTGQTVEDEIYDEAIKFRKILRKHIDKYNFQNTLEDYMKRTVNLSGAVGIYNFQIVNNSISFKIGFDKKKVTHESVFGSKYDSGYTPILYDQGWKVSKPVWFRDIELFGFMNPTYYVKKAINEFKQSSRFKFDIVAEYEVNISTGSYEWVDSY
jgi:hypothetical protein